MTAITASGDGRNAHGQAYKDKSKPTDIRSSNINAAKGKYIIILKCFTFHWLFFILLIKILPYMVIL